MRPRPIAPVLATSALALLLTACAATADPPPATTAAAYGPLELTSLMVLSPDGDHILGNIGEVRVGPDGLARTVVIDGGAPLFPQGRTMVVDAVDLRAAPFLGTTWLVGAPWRVLAGFDRPEAVARAPGAVGTPPTDWRPAVR